MHVYSCTVHATSPDVGRHLQETLGLVFRQFAQLIARRQALDPQAMTRGDYALLATLEQCHDEAGRRTSHLAELLAQDASTVSRRLTQLEMHGLVERLPDPSDGRASTMRLSTEGAAALDCERTARTGLLSTILDDWPHDDLATLDHLLTRLSADLAADAQAAGHLPSPLTTGKTSA